MQIGELARATDTRVVTIRYYEKIGLLPKPLRTRGNYRAYDMAAQNRLGFIRRCRGLGFSLDEIRELISLSEQSDAPCDRVNALTARHLSEVQAKIADLQKLANQLAAIGQSCDGGHKIADCGILEAIFTGDAPPG